MTLDEVIFHATEVAEKCELEYERNPEQLGFVETFYNAKKCASEHRQLTEWLKDYKRLLGAIDDIKKEIEEITKCHYGDKCLGWNCPSNTDCMLQGEHIIKIIDKHINGKKSYE